MASVFPPSSARAEQVVSAPTFVVPAQAEVSAPALPPVTAETDEDSFVHASQLAAYAREISPLWTQPFAQLLVSQAPQLGKSTILDVMCRAGEAGLPLLRRSPQARLVAIDTAAGLLDIARREAGPLLGRRVFLRTQGCQPKLPFDSEVYDLVLSNLGLSSVEDPRRLLREMFRVAKPGATVLATVPLRGSFAEFYEIVARLLSHRPREAALLEQHVATRPEPLLLYSWALEAGLEDVSIVMRPFSLLFAGGPDFFYAPLIAQGPLPSWLPLFGEQHADREATFVQLCAAIDDVARGKDATVRTPARPVFSVTVRAACLCARRPLPPAALSFEEDPENAPTRPGLL